VLEHATPVAEAGLRLGVGPLLTLGAGGGYVFADRAPFAGRSVKLDLAYAQLRGGFRVVESKATRVDVDAGGLLGSLSGEGSGFTRWGTRHLLWVAAAAGVELSATLAPLFAWSARLSALVPLVDEGFSIETNGRTEPAFSTPPVGGMLTLGVTLTR
jgi:hypothetical protein